MKDSYFAHCINKHIGRFFHFDAAQDPMVAQTNIRLHFRRPWHASARRYEVELVAASSLPDDEVVYSSDTPEQRLEAEDMVKRIMQSVFDDLDRLHGLKLSFWARLKFLFNH